MEVIITARKPEARALHGRVADAHAALPRLLGELDDEDAVLGRQRDQYHEADLRVDVQAHPGDLDR
jgi:hypothetical protein